MGQDAQTDQRHAFEDYQVNAAMMARAGSDACSCTAFPPAGV